MNSLPKLFLAALVMCALAGAAMGAPIIVAPGTDLAKLLPTAKPGAVYQLMKGGNVTASKRIDFLVPGIEIDANGGTLTAEGFGGALFNFLSSGANVHHFAKIDADAQNTIFKIVGAKCSVTNNTSADGSLKFVETTENAAGAVVANNVIGQTGSVSLYYCSDDITVANNNFRGSWGENILRGGPKTDPKTGKPIYIDGVLQRPQRASIYGNTLDNRCNLKGKQSAAFRGADRVNAWNNIFYGVVRFGDPILEGNVTPDARCAFLSFHGNKFVMTGTASSKTTNPIEVIGGVTGSFYANIFQLGTGDYSPFAVAKTNAVTITSNVQQFTAGQKQKPLVAPSSDPKSYAVGEGNIVVIVPK